jgi:hypothetical protein
MSTMSTHATLGNYSSTGIKIASLPGPFSTVKESYKKKNYYDAKHLEIGYGPTTAKESYKNDGNHLEIGYGPTTVKESYKNKNYYDESFEDTFHAAPLAVRRENFKNYHPMYGSLRTIK